MRANEPLQIVEMVSATGARILKLTGPLGLQSKEAFEQTIRNDRTKPLIIDLSGVNFMDSAGLGSVIGAFTGCQSNSRGFALAGLSQHIKEVLKVTHLDGLIPFFDTLEAAEKSLAK